jgi:hypothetical protein
VTLRKIIAIREDTTWQAIHEHEELKSLNASLMGAAQGLGALCDRYKTENDQLKSIAKLDDSTISVLNACVDDLNAENFRLRTLVRDVWDAALHPEMFGDGSYLLRRMQELGIEV